MTQKTYVPKSSAKEKTFDDGGSIIKLSFHADTLADFARNHQNERGYINMNVTRRKTPSERGDTHSISLDTWQPTKQPGQAAPAATRPAPADRDSSVPF